MTELALKEKIFLAIRQSPTFRVLDSAASRRLADNAGIRTAKSGESLISHMDSDGDVYIMAEGVAKVTVYARSGREIAFRNIFPGMHFGELAAIDDLPRSANVVAVGPVLAGVIPKKVFVDLLRSEPALALSTMRGLSLMVRSLSLRVAEFSAPVESRVCSELLRLAEYGEVVADGIRLKPSPTHAEIASRINAQREAVTRALGKLSKRGLIAMRRRAITVRDLEGIELCAELEKI